jgi:transposase
MIEKNLTELLDLPQASVIGVSRIIDAHICFHIQLDNKEIHCPHCHTATRELHQNRPILIRDLSVFGKAVYLRIPRRKFYCRKCQRYSTERLDWLDWRRTHTKRYELNIFERIKGTSIEKIATEEGLSFDEIEGIFKHVCESQVKKNWLPTPRVSIDEVTMRKGHKNFKTVVSDLERKKLIEVIDGHNQESIVKTLMEQPLELREMVQEVSIDMWGGFGKIIPEIFPKAQIVTDRFHVMKPLIKELKIIANQVGIKGWKKLTLILRNKQELKEQELEQLEQLLKTSKRLRKAYTYKEEFRLIYEDSKTVEEGKEKFTEWLKKANCIYGQVISTIQNHLDTICNYFLSRTSSGVMEGINNKIKQIKRQAYGFTNFDNFRLRLLVCFLD